MTIDEAIAHAREVAENKRKMSEELWKYNDKYGVNEKQKERCISCAEEHEQLADWLEKLKMYEEKPDGYLANECELAGYNKAIDDYMNKLCNHCMQQTNECYKLECPFCTDGCDIVNIGEQLKKGANNE